MKQPGTYTKMSFHSISYHLILSPFGGCDTKSTKYVIVICFNVYTYVISSQYTHMPTHRNCIRFRIFRENPFILQNQYCSIHTAYRKSLQSGLQYNHHVRVPISVNFNFFICILQKFPKCQGKFEDRFKRTIFGNYLRRRKQYCVKFIEQLTSYKSDLGVIVA